MKKAWDRIVRGREHGLSEIIDESSPPHREQICCEIKDELQTQEQDSDVQGL
jgi:hypothetical protein